MATPANTLIGDLNGGVSDPGGPAHVVWATCTCGATFGRRVGKPDAGLGPGEPR